MDLREEVSNLFEMQAFIRSLRGHPVEAGCWYSDHETSLFSAYEGVPTICTATAIQSVAMFCYDCWLKFRGSAWAVANHNCGQPAMGTFQNINFKTSRLTGWRTLYFNEETNSRQLPINLRFPWAARPSTCRGTSHRRRGETQRLRGRGTFLVRLRHRTRFRRYLKT